MPLTDPYTKVPFVVLSQRKSALKAELLKACENVLDHGQYILGPEVTEFERRFAEYCGVRHALGTDNGTNALLLVLRALGIGAGDEVITAANSFLASASCIALAGARPVLVDVGPDYTMDPDLVEAAIGPKTKAIIPVHLTGRPAEMERIMEIANRHGIAVIEDAAQAAGAEFRGKKTGSFGIAGCFSLHPLKVLSAAGDGGMITTDSDELHSYLIKARNHGLMSRDACEFWSYNSRLDTIQAAMLLVKLDHLEEWIARRREVAEGYRQGLEGLVGLPPEHSYERPVYQTFMIRCQKRDELQAFLQSRGIDSKVHYPVPIHLQQAAHDLGYHVGSFPVTERLSGEILSLPIYPEMTGRQIEAVIGGIREFYAAKER